MCQFCHQHGEGKTWYLRAENYAEDLLSDLKRRRFISDFVRKTAREDDGAVEDSLDKVPRAPAWLRGLTFSLLEKRFRRDHFGQVVPIEDVERVLALAGSIVRFPCICRKNRTGRTDNSFCFGLGIDPEKLLDIKAAFLESFKPGPEEKLFERMTLTEALELQRGFEKRGLVHTLWTFKTPFIGGLCNCDGRDCLALICHSHGLNLFFRGEYVAQIDARNCSGCGACGCLCRFGAIRPGPDGTTLIDPVRCYGCGICRSACEFDAIALAPRSDHPRARDLW
ncbi:MAG: 4Fe-4S binding protein [Desulfobacteraceae bacterium]|nr:4Fe-4S binding protein [Desulfobacteraceae bacterium]